MWPLIFFVCCALPLDIVTGATINYIEENSARNNFTDTQNNVADKDSSTGFESESSILVQDSNAGSGE